MKASSAKARAVPAQARGVRRVEAILDAAASLVGEVGYEAMTLTAVAERSGSAIPSLYRFFANKDQLMNALADRMAAQIRALAEAVLDVDLATRSLPEFVRNLVERIVEHVLKYPGVGEIMGRFEVRNFSVDVEIANRLDVVVKARRPSLARSERAAIVLMTMSIIRCGVRLIENTEKSRRAVLTKELVTVVESYLGARLG